MEDLLDDERIRQKIEVLEQQETFREKKIEKSQFTPELESPSKTGNDFLTENPSKSNTKQQLALPEIGSFSLIQDLVKDFTGLAKKQVNERKKLDCDSLRAYAGSLRATKVGKSAFWGDKKPMAIQVSQDDDELTRRRTTQIRPSTLKNEDSLVGRFTTSTKSWLQGYDTVRVQFKERKKTEESRNHTSVGRALFNLKRTLPPSSKEEANAFIKQTRSRIVSPISDVIKTPRDLSNFLNTS